MCNHTLVPLLGLCDKICPDGRHFSDNQVDQLRHLGGWSVQSGVVHIYVKKIIEQYSDSAGLLTPGRY